MTTAGTTVLVEHLSPVPFGPTLDRLVAAIAAAGLMLFARIDHAALAEGVGLAMPPATVLIYGNPKGGTPVMQAAPAVALDLPLRVLVREEPGGRVVVAFHPIGPLLLSAGVPAALAARLDPAQQLLVKALGS